MKMKAILTVFLTVVCATAFATAGYAYNFGDHKSVTLVNKAWGALKQNDVEGVLAYTNKCLELYAEKAQKMQDELTDYPTGEKEDVFKYWALNDVATALFIQGEAYRQAGMIEEAKQVYIKLISTYPFGQAWDNGGWFWKPAEAAQEKLTMMDAGVELDFGNNSSSFLVDQAWKALNNDALDTAVIYADKVLSMYAAEAKDMQDSLTEYPWESKENILNYWALNDVGTALFIKGEAYKKAGEAEKAKKAYQTLVDHFYYAQCWDPQGWFWKPSEVAEQAIEELNT